MNDRPIDVRSLLSTARAEALRVHDSPIRADELSGRIEEIVEAGYAHSREVLDSGRDAPWHARIMAEPEAPAPKPGE